MVTEEVRGAVDNQPTRRLGPVGRGGRSTVAAEIGSADVAVPVTVDVTDEAAIAAGFDAAALAFVTARQLLPGHIPAALDPTLALGGFSGTPVDDTLRADIAGHALLALI